MADEQQFIEQGLRRSQIDEFFADELGRAGYGGMEMAPTPMGIQIVLKAEKPGMVIGKGGKNIRKITRELNERFDLEDPQIDVQEVDEPDLNARIVADRLANALERGWYFRKAGHTTVDRIMEAGALGAEIVLAGKVTGNRGRVEKFNRGYIKHNGEPAEEIVDEGQSVAVMQLGTIGVTVKIIPPGADLPDDFAVADDADVSDLIAEEDSEGVEELLEGEPEGDFDAADVPDEADEGRPSPGEGTADPVEFPDEEEIVEEVDEGRAPTSTNEEDVEEELDDLEAEIDAEVDEEAAAEAADLVDEMETDETEDDEE